MDIAKVFDQYVLDNVEDRESDGLLHPSSMSGCWRQAVYEAQAVAPTDGKEVRNYRIMRLGTIIHGELQASLEGLPGFRAEVEVAPQGWPVIGHADGIYVIGQTPDRSLHELLEFKSISPFAFKKPLPKPGHVRQARAYCWGLNKMGTEVVSIRIVYLSRDDMAIREFVLDRDLDWEKDFEDQLLVSQSIYLKPGSTWLPPRLEPKSEDAWLCDYCQFRTRCWNRDEDARRVD